MSTYREQGRDIDVTEIERAKIHEAAETQRKTIEEREKTRRVRLEQYGVGSLLLAGVLGVCAVISTAFVAHFYIDAKHPTPPRPPEPCSESAEVLSSSDSSRHCVNGGHIEIVPIGDGKIVWKCLCSPRTTGDGGTP